MPKIRYEINGIIEVLSPLHVGSGETHEVDKVKGKHGSNQPPQVAAIVRDHACKAYIPGSTLKGLLRRLGEGVFQSSKDPRVISLFGSASNKDEGNAGSLIVRGAKLENAQPVPHAPYAHPVPKLEGEKVPGEGIFVSARTAIDGATGTASANKLFFQEMVAPKTTFKLKLLLEFSRKIKREDAAAQLQDLVVILGELARESGEAIGKGQADGCGHIRLLNEGIKIKRFSLDEGGYFADSDVTEVWANRTKRPERQSTRSWKVNLKCDGPFIIVDSSRVVKKTKGDAPNNKPQIPAQTLDERTPLILGSSISGALRARLQWLVDCDNIETSSASVPKGPSRKLNNKSEIETLDSVGKLFGITGFRAMLTVSNIKITEAEKWDVTSVKLDRFSSGPIDNELFTTRTFVGSELSFQLSVKERPEATLAEKDDEYLSRLVEDLRTNGLMLGHGTNKGFGWFELQECAR